MGRGLGHHSYPWQQPCGGPWWLVRLWSQAAAAAGTAAGSWWRRWGSEIACRCSESETPGRQSRAKGVLAKGDSHKVRLSDSEVQVINASASHTQPTDTPPPYSSCACVCACGHGREIPALGGPKMVGRERQTHLDMARIDRYASVYSTCVTGWGYRSGWGLVQSARQRGRLSLDLAKAQINTNMNSSFLCVFPHIANTHLWCGSEGEPRYTDHSVPAAPHVGARVRFA